MNRADKSAAVRAAIITAATTVFTTLGYERATLRDIASTARRSTGAIYSQWSHKRELYIEAMGQPPVTGDQLRKALQSLLDLYTGLVNSGDAGNWNPEEEPEVIAARKALGQAA